MGYFPKIFRRFIPQILHMIVLPSFFFFAVLIYRPIDSQELIGNSYFGVHLTLLSCIILVSEIVLRLFYYVLPMRLNYALYVFWCLGEMVFMSFFTALYIWRALYPAVPYLEIFLHSFQMVSLTLIVPYVILGLSIRIHEYHEKAQISNEPLAQKRIRFYDNRHNLKLVLTPHTILYLSSDENYVHIFYVENDKMRKYVLRSSMKAIEEVCIENGLVRCHRSYLINPSHVKVLRKEHDGIVYAELDSQEAMHIPVTKRYYEALSSLL